MAQESTAGLPFTSIGFQGTAEINGEGVIFGHTQGYKNMGATVDPDDSNNDGLIPYYGLVVSSSSGSAEDLVALGQPSGYVVRGILQFDAAVAQNDPAKATYVLPGLPTSIIYAGTAKYQSWTTTQSGADDPALGCVPIFRATSAGTGDAPSGLGLQKRQGSVESWTRLHPDGHESRQCPTSGSLAVRGGGARQSAVINTE